MPVCWEGPAAKGRAAFGTAMWQQVGSFCRDRFAGVTELRFGVCDNSLIVLTLAPGTRVARKTCVRSDSGVWNERRQHEQYRWWKRGEFVVVRQPAQIGR